MAEPSLPEAVRGSSLTVRGARQHNLQNITVTIPRDRLVVITGPSGSGKSSLAFDTIYAEAQRRYVESLSVYARQFLGQMPKPEMDSIEGLSPAICVRQQGVSRNPRSTVGTLTEIYDYLRLLYARAGVAHSPHTGKPMVAFSVDQVVDRLVSLPEDARLTIAAPVARAQQGGMGKLLARLRKEGFVRVAIDGAVRDLGEDIELDERRPHDVEVHVDRVRVRGSARKRISEAVELSYKLSHGLVHAFAEQGFDWLASERLMCVESSESYGELSPRSFSFNSPEGACPECDGLGETLEIDPELVVPDTRASIRDGAIAGLGHCRRAVLSGQAGGAGRERRGRRGSRLGEARQGRAEAGAVRRRGEEEALFSGQLGGRDSGPHPHPERSAQGAPRRRPGGARGGELPRGRCRTLRPGRSLSGLQGLASVAAGTRGHRAGRDVAGALVAAARAAVGVLRLPGALRQRRAGGGACPARHHLTYLCAARARARIPLARSQHAHAVGRGDRAHQAGHPDRIGPAGGAVRAGRAVGGPPSARQRAADRQPPAAARPGQLVAGRGARRGHYPRRRSCARSR